MSKHYELLQRIEQEQRDGQDTIGRTARPSRIETDLVEQSRIADLEVQRVVQQVFLLGSDPAPRVVIFAGIDHGNGCSHTCASVARLLAHNSSATVCLVEANFRTPGISSIFGIGNHFGLTNALRDTSPLASFVKPIEPHNLWLLSSGNIREDSTNLLSSDSLRVRIEELRKDFGFVIVDAPPLARYSDAVVLAQHSDGLVMVIEAEATRREAASSAVQSLRAANIPILAAVLNKRTYPIPERLYRMV